MAEQSKMGSQQSKQDFGSSSDLSAASAKASKIIEENAVVVFSKSYCPYCRASKELLSELGAKFYAIELDQIDDGTQIQDALAALTGQRTVPNIFIHRKHVGGNSDLQKLRDRLPEMLKDAGAI